MPATTSCAYSEHLPNAPDDDRYIPDMAFAFYDRMVIFDQINKTILVIAHTRPDESRSAIGLRPRRRPASTSCAPSWNVPRANSGLSDIRLTVEPQPGWQSNVTRGRI